jgi:hypothetical protein
MGAILSQSLASPELIASMENEYMKRGYLLPPGCKDLSDVLKLKHKHVQSGFFKAPAWISEVSMGFEKVPEPLPPVTGQIFITPGTSVMKLAALLGQKPFVIVADLMKLGMFATIDFLLDFKTISKVARMHGFTAIKAAF